MTSENRHGHGMDAMLDLMDRQIVDCDGRMVAKVDDVELQERADGRLVVSALLTGPGALGPRLGGALGAITAATWSRLSGRATEDPKLINFEAVAELGIVVKLAISRRKAGVDGFEVWMREHIISSLPGSGKEPT